MVQNRLFALFIILLVTSIQVINIFGFIGVTKLAFYNNTNSSTDTVSVSLTDTELTMLKISIVLQIISISSILVSYIEDIAGIQSNTKLGLFNAIFYIVYFLGLVFVSKFAFTAESLGDNRSSNLTNAEMALIKIASVVQWISIIMVILLVFLMVF